MSKQPIKAPFPYFGGKSRIATAVWERLGDVPSYVEPFFGSGAVLLARPHAPRIETVNDADGLLANFWRAMVHAPEEVARWADWPVNEADLHARHLWLVGQRERLTERLMADPDFFDAKAAGWWVWGASCWIGSGWCSGRGPWGAVDGVFTHLGTAGQGVNRQMPRLFAGRGVNRQPPHLGSAGQGVAAALMPVAERMRRVRVVCGDWSRLLGDSVLFPTGRASGGGLSAAGALCGVMLDPPYRSANAIEYGGGGVDHAAIEAWCRDNGDRPQLRIALCGYEGEYDLPGWSVMAWKAHGGFGNQGQGRGRKNSAKERIWFSPHCLAAAALSLDLGAP